MVARSYRVRDSTLPSASGPEGRGDTRIGPAFARALALAGVDPLQVVLIGGRANADRVLEGLRVEPPPKAAVRVAARPGLVVVDATGADEAGLRRLARILPKRRPLDAIACVTGPDGEVDAGGIELAGRFARRLGVRAAVHLVVPADADRPVFEPCPESAEPDAAALVRGLRERLVHGWLRGARRPRLTSAAVGSPARMEAGVAAVIGKLGSEPLVLASLAWGGPGLEAAVENASDRTVPRGSGGRESWVARIAGAVLAAGAVLGAAGGFSQAERVEEVRGALGVLTPVLRGARHEPGALAGEARARRFASAAAALARAGEASVTSPFAAFHPGTGALRILASRTWTDAVVRPALVAVRDRVARELAPGVDPDAWLDRAGPMLAQRRAHGRLGAAALLAAAYGAPERSWSRVLAHAPSDLRVPAAPPFEEAGSGFVRTVGAWARIRFAEGSLSESARRAVGRAGWRERMEALQATRAALGAGEGIWLVPERKDPELERVLARARGVLDERAVGRARAAVQRERETLRREFAELRLGDAYPLVVVDPDGGAALGPAALRLLRGYETMAGEELLARAPRGRTREVAMAGFSARMTLADLERLERRLTDTPVDLGLRDSFVNEIETAALDEAATRIEAAATESFGGRERAALHAIERRARARGAIGAAGRLAAVRARLDEATSDAARRGIEAEDPLAVEFDESTDTQAVRDRVLAGIERLDAEYRLRPAYRDLRWRDLGRALRGYRNGDPSSALTRLADRARDVAARGMSVCADGTRGFDARGGAAAPPESYPERALAAFERRLGAMCRRESARADADERVRLGRFFRDHLGWRWPYSGDPNASAAPRSTLIEFLHRAESVEAGPPGSELEAVVRPWGRNRDGDPVLELGVEWRTAPERERNAEHLADYRLEGLAELGHGVREWRYGDPLHARLRLAKDSPFRFAGGAVEARIPIGEGSWVGRLATGAPTAPLMIEAPVVSGHRDAGRLLVSATLTVLRAPRLEPSRPSRDRWRPVYASPGPLAGLP